MRVICDLPHLAHHLLFPSDHPRTPIRALERTQDPPEREICNGNDTSVGSPTSRMRPSRGCLGSLIEPSSALTSNPQSTL